MQNHASLARELVKECRSMDDIHEKLKELFQRDPTTNSGSRNGGAPRLPKT